MRPENSIEQLRTSHELVGAGARTARLGQVGLRVTKKPPGKEGSTYSGSVIGELVAEAL